MPSNSSVYINIVTERSQKLGIKCTRNGQPDRKGREHKVWSIMSFHHCKRYNLHYCCESKPRQRESGISSVKNRIADFNTYTHRSPGMCRLFTFSYLLHNSLGFEHQRRPGRKRRRRSLLNVIGLPFKCGQPHVFFHPAAAAIIVKCEE